MSKGKIRGYRRKLASVVSRDRCERRFSRKNDVKFWQEDDAVLIASG